MNPNKNKTIAIFINTSWNIYNFRLQLMRRLQSEGYRVIAIAPEDGYVQKIEEAGFEYHSIDINNMGTNPLEDLKLIGAIFRLYQKIQPDLLLHYTNKPNIYGSVAAKLPGSGIDPQHYLPAQNGNGKDHPFVFLLIARMRSTPGRNSRALTTWGIQTMS